MTYSKKVFLQIAVTIIVFSFMVGCKPDATISFSEFFEKPNRYLGHDVMYLDGLILYRNKDVIVITSVNLPEEISETNIVGASISSDFRDLKIGDIVNLHGFITLVQKDTKKAFYVSRLLGIRKTGGQDTETKDFKQFTAVIHQKVMQDAADGWAQWWRSVMISAFGASGGL